MKFILFWLASILAFKSIAQIPNNTKTIAVKGVSFLQVCNALLDQEYKIQQKDNDLQTTTTEARPYPKYWNATYILYIRVKDSTAFISGTFTGAEGELFKNEPVVYLTNKKGEPHEKSLITYPFLLMNAFALSFNKQIEYK